MPLPKPASAENQDDFISRCMGDATMVKEYDQKQRAAICFQQWRDRHKHSVKSAIEEFRRTLEAAAKEGRSAHD